MLNDEFLKERQNIREKMLKFSRAMSQGKPLDDDLRDEFNDTIFKRRLNKKSIHDDVLDKKENANIYLKQDLINVKLEEKQSLSKKILLKIKKEKKSEKKLDKKIERKNEKKLFSFLFKKKEKAQISKPDLKPKTNLKSAKISTNQANLNKNLNQNLNKSLDKKINENIKKATNLKENLAKQSPKTQINKNLEKTKKVLNNESLKKVEIKKENLDLKKQILKSEIPNKTNETSIENENTKNDLLSGFSEATKEDRNLNLNHIFAVMIALSFALFLFIPQIYIRNHIYYLSREIATLRADEAVLSEENKELQRNLENMRFKNQILDYLE